MTERQQGEGQLDLIAVGRSSVDLYGEQTGGRLEDMLSFAKYVGGSPTNTVIGAARLGLRAGLLTRVGSDHMGRFIREQVAREGVDVTGVLTDPDRLTALAMLGIRGPDSFPLIFYRENCADMALCEDDVDPAFIARAGALLINGTHLSRPGVFAASMKAATLMKARGGKLVFDVDYQPVLWGLAAKDNGEDRFVESCAVTIELQRVLPLCDLIVGTEEEMHILGGSNDTMTALRAIRQVSDALLVCKLGPKGCVAFPEALPASLDDGIAGRGFAIEIFNVLGAGDAFMAGLLRGWLRGEPIERCCTLANACGAIVVSRHGCAPAEPTWDELELFLSREDWPFRLRDSAALEQMHWAGNRHPEYPALTVLAIDHRSQFDDLVAALGANALDRVPQFKDLTLQAMDRVARNNPGFGLLADGRFGMRALEAAADTAYWIGRPIEVPGSRPVEFEGGIDVATTLSAWPVNHVVKCLVFYHPNDAPELRVEQDRQIMLLASAARSTRHELLLEIVASKHGAVGPNTVAAVISHIYDLGVYPDWWKLEPAADAASWETIQRVIQTRDSLCRGIVLLGLAAPRQDLLASFAATAGISLVKGFAVGRTIWNETAERWLGNEIGDREAVDMLAGNFQQLVDDWCAARGHKAAA